MQNKKKPDFFIVGAAKSGTTSLYEYLNKIPEIYLPSVKEPNFFSHKEIADQGLYYKTKDIKSEQEYLDLFAQAGKDQKCGDASVSYLFYPECAKRIHAFNPDAKIIILLRNPVKRAFSHYLMDKRLGYIHEEFDQIIKSNQEGTKEMKLYYQQVVQLGFYAEQITRYFAVFPKDQILILLLENLIESPEASLRKITEFIGVSSLENQNVFTKHNASFHAKNKLIRKLYSFSFIRKTIKALTPKVLRNRILDLSSKESEQMSPEISDYLKSLYKEDLLKLQNIIQRDLHKWYV